MGKALSVLESRHQVLGWWLALLIIFVNSPAHVFKWKVEEFFFNLILSAMQMQLSEKYASSSSQPNGQSQIFLVEHTNYGATSRVWS